MAREIEKEFNGRKFPALVLNDGDDEKYWVWFGKAKLRVILDRSNDIKNFYEVCKDGSVWETLKDYEKETLTLKTIGGKMKLDLTPEVNVSKEPFLISEHQARVIIDSLMPIVSYIEKDDASKLRYGNQKVQENMDAENKRKSMFAGRKFR